MLKIITKDKLTDWLAFISREYELWVPQEEEGGVLLAPYQPERGFNLKLMPKLSAKEVVFPQTECLLKYSYNKDTVNPEQVEVSLEASNPHHKTVIWGIRPCDVAGISFLEKVFTSNGYHDPYFKSRRKECVIVAVGCRHPEATCFCTAVGGSPAEAPGADLLLTRIDNEYGAEILSERGKDLINEDLFSTPAKGKIESIKQAKQAACNEMPFRLEESLPAVADKILQAFEFPYWKEATTACISCGICTYVCPTCYCFNIADEARGMEGERLRCWDTCMSYTYTLEASGHNPRIIKYQRYRNRINHKFSYLITNNDIVGCTGCGRCIKECPANIDLRHIVAHLLEKG
jgi:ferredoxin